MTDFNQNWTLSLLASNLWKTISRRSYFLVCSYVADRKKSYQLSASWCPKGYLINTWRFHDFSVFMRFLLLLLVIKPIMIKMKAKIIPRYTKRWITEFWMSSLLLLKINWYFLSHRKSNNKIKFSQATFNPGLTFFTIKLNTFPISQYTKYP